MQGLPWLLVVFASCSSTPELRSTRGGAQGSATVPTMDAAPVRSAAVSPVKIAIEQAADLEEPQVSFSWGALSFRAPAHWRVVALTQGKLVMPAGDGPFVAALFVDPSENDPVAELERALDASHCSWLPETMGKVGAAAVEAHFAEGVCERESESLSVARVRYAATGVAFFLWASVADPAPLWPVARSVDDLSPHRLAPCCQALRLRAKSAPGPLIERYQHAVDICTLGRAGANPDTLAKLRATLLDESLPDACR